MNEPEVPPKATFEQVSRGSVHGLDQFNFSSAKQFTERPLRGLGALEDDAAVGLASAWKGRECGMHGRFIHDHMVVTQHVSVQLERFIHVADAQHGSPHTTSKRCRTKPLLALDHLEEIAMWVLEVKVLAPVGASVNGSQGVNAPAHVLGMHRVGVLALDFANENACVSQLTFKGSRLGFSACELPNLHPSTSPHVQRQRRVTGMHFTSGVSCHQGGLRSLLKHPNVNPKCVTIPLPRLVYVRNADADLLDAADQFCHGTKMPNDLRRLFIWSSSFLHIARRNT